MYRLFYWNHTPCSYTKGMSLLQTHTVYSTVSFKVLKKAKSTWLLKVNERQACCLALSNSRWEYSPWRLNWTATVLQFVSSVLLSTPVTSLFLFLNLISGLNEKQWLTNQHHCLLSHTAVCLTRYLPGTLFYPPTQTLRVSSQMGIFLCGFMQIDNRKIKQVKFCSKKKDFKCK